MLLVVVLTMIVALTVGLSVVSRTITNLRIARQTDESQRAFQAAEAGIERALQSGQDELESGFDNNATFTTTVSNLSGANVILNGGEMVDQDIGIDVWLSDYPDYENPITTDGNDLTIYWGDPNQTDCTNAGAENVSAAVEVAVLSGTVLNPTLNKYVLEARNTANGLSCGRIAGASTAAAGGTVLGITYLNSAVLPAVTNGLVMRVIPIYNSTGMAIVSGGPALPNQGKVIESVGESGETVRKVQYFSSHPQIPLEIFPYSLISQ